jgi:prophage antirepressor-like protein
MQKINIFQHEMFGEIRVVINEKSEPMFCGIDVAKALGYKEPKQAITTYCKSGELVYQPHANGIGGTNVKFIKEPDVYRLVMRSELPSAEKFQDWVCEDVLPSIRKHGAYMSDEVIKRTLSDPDYLIQLATVLKEEKQKRAEAETTVAILTHTNKTYTATEVAKEMGMRSAKELNKWLEQQHVQYKVNETWVPCAKYSDMAWFEIKQEELDNGHIIYHRKITGLGREGILDLYNSVNRTDILP